MKGVVTVADELADLPAAPAQRDADRVSPGATLGPGDGAVLEHERRAGRANRLHAGLHDRLERLLEVERLRNGFRQRGQRLELPHAPLRVVVELRVLDRLGDLAGDRHEQVDLRLAELTRGLGADVERPFEPVPGEDRHGQDGLVLLLAQIGEALEARVEVRFARDHDRRALGGGGAGDPLAGTHLRHARHLVDASPARSSED